MNQFSRKSIGRIIKGLPVNTVYLFGSAARNDRGPVSDLDFAIQAKIGLSDRQRFRLKLTMLDRLSKAFSTDAIDVVLLEEAPPLLAHRILKDGKILYCRNPLLRVRNEFRLLTTYLDFKEDLDLFAQATLHG
jgi:predicted nucleotidyltransferase